MGERLVQSTLPIRKVGERTLESPSHIATEPTVTFGVTPDGKSFMFVRTSDGRSLPVQVDPNQLPLENNSVHVHAHSKRAIAQVKQFSDRQRVDIPLTADHNKSMTKEERKKKKNRDEAILVGENRFLHQTTHTLSDVVTYVYNQENNRDGWFLKTDIAASAALSFIAHSLEGSTAIGSAAATHDPVQSLLNTAITMFIINPTLKNTYVAGRVIFQELPRLRQQLKNGEITQEDYDRYKKLYFTIVKLNYIPLLNYFGIILTGIARYEDIISAKLEEHGPNLYKTLNRQNLLDPKNTPLPSFNK